MLVIFFVTMRVHYSGIDYSYLLYATGHMIWLAVPSGILGAVMRKQNLAIRIFTSIVVGLFTAALFIYLK